MTDGSGVLHIRGVFVLLAVHSGLQLGAGALNVPVFEIEAAENGGTGIAEGVATRNYSASYIQ